MLTTKENSLNVQKTLESEGHEQKTFGRSIYWLVVLDPNMIANIVCSPKRVLHFFLQLACETHFTGVVWSCRYRLSGFQDWIPTETPVQLVGSR